MRRYIAVLCLIVSSSFCGSAQGVEFTFTKIVDTNTIIPGLDIAFTGFGLPSIDAGKIVFRGIGVGYEGVFLYDDSGIE